MWRYLLSNHRLFAVELANIAYDLKPSDLEDKVSARLIGSLRDISKTGLTGLQATSLRIVAVRCSACATKKSKICLLKGLMDTCHRRKPKQSMAINGS